MIALNCPGCQKKLSVKDELAGKKIKCPGCGTLVLVAETTAATVAAKSVSGEERTLPPRTPVRDEATLPPKTKNQATSDSLSDSDNQTRPNAAASSLNSPELTEFLAPAQQTDEIGRLGPFRVLKVLGAGGMGVVYKAEDPQLKRLVALKAMLPTLGASESARKRFLREAQSAAAIVHDHIVPIHQVGEDRGIPFVAMQFLEGEPLDERLKREGCMGIGEVLRIGRETAEGLAAAHDKGLIHRDIKPANIWLEGKKGRVKILDFGLARAAADDSHLTQTGAILGTPAYMAPEQAAGEKVDARCDLFSLGCVLYRMCTGEFPFKGKDSISTLVAVATENPDPPDEINPEVPAELSDLVMTLLAKKPAERPQSAHVVAETLQSIDPKTAEMPARSVLKNKTPKGKEGGKAQMEPGRKPGKKKRLPVSWLIGGGVLGLVLLAAVIVVFWRSPHGLVRIESDDPNVEIVFMKDGPTIKGVGKDPISIRSGEYSLLIKRGDFQFETNKLFIAKGKTIALKVELLAGKVKVSADGHVIGNEEMPLAKAFTNSLGMEFVLVPKGKSWLGGGGGKPGDKQVEILEDFYLGKYEVTQEEWEKVTGLSPSRFKDVAGVGPKEQKRFPVEMVSWEDCQEFVKQINKQVKELGWMYRLPTKMEWEYGCRGGPLTDKLESASDFYFEKPSNTLLPGQANFEHGKGLKRTCKVGSYRPNRLGLYDMHGNVWEWCEDEEPQPKGASNRVTRGGSWFNDANICQAANRGAAPPPARTDSLGLRLARVPIGKEIVKAVPPERNAETGITEYSEVHQVDEKRFDAWIAQMKKDGFFPVGLSVQTVKDVPYFTAVAVKSKNAKAWEMTRIAIDDKERPGMADGMAAKNYHAIAQCLYRTKGKSPYWEAFLWAWDPNGPPGGLWTGPRNAVEDRIEAGRGMKLRPVHRTALLSGGDIVYNVVLAKKDDGPWLDSVNQSFDECKAWVEKHKAQGWRLEHLYAYGSGPKTLFGNILIQAAGPDWDVSWALTPAQYEVEVAQRKRQGFRPHSPVAHESENGDLRFSTMWIRYRSDAPEKWVQLFNGRDLTGWKLHPGVAPGKWTVDKGVLHYQAGEKVEKGGHGVLLVSERGDYRDVHVRLECNRGQGNGGLRVRVLPESLSWSGYYAKIAHAHPQVAIGSLVIGPKNIIQLTQAKFGDGTSKVGSYTPNRLGLYDMHGNVGEWCEDSEKAGDGAPRRVWRGGSWSSTAQECRASAHHATPPRQAQDNIGLRLARVPVGKEIVKANQPVKK